MNTSLPLKPAKPGKVLVVGASVLDRIFYVKQLPVKGETAIGEAMDTFPGGKGANQALAAALLGADVKFLSAVGQDDAAGKVLKPLMQHGVDISAVFHIAGENTAQAMIAVDEKGENQIVACPGAYLKFTCDHIKERKDLFEWADWLLIQNELPRTTVDCAIKLAQEHGCQVLFNPAPFKRKSAPPPRNLDYIIPNEVEAAGLLGIEDYLSFSPTVRAEMWSVLGAKNTIVTLGPSGGEWINEKNEVKMTPPPPGMKAVDTVGAGDAFCGILAALLSEGLDPKEAMRWAHAGASMSVTRKGAQTGLPSRKELVEQFND